MRWRWLKHESNRGGARRVTRWRVLLLAAVLSCGTSDVLAQKLNLGGSGPFVSDPGYAAAELEAALRRVAEKPGEDIAIAALAMLGADLAKAGVAVGESGSWSVVAAMTIRDRLDDARARLAGMQGDLDVLRAAMVRDLQHDDASMITDERWVRTALRDALAPLLPAAGERAAPAWWREVSDGAEAALPESLAVLVAGRNASDRLIEVVKRLDERLAAASQWWAYRAAAETARRAVVRAAPLALEPAGWLSRGAKESAAEEFGRSVAAIADAAHQRDAVARLRRLADLNELVTLCGGVDDAKGMLRVAVSDFVAAVPDRLDEDYAKRLVAGLRAGRLLREGEPLADEVRVVRPLRPGVRVLAVPARESATGVRDAVPRLLKSALAMNDPAVLSALNSHRECVEDLRRVRGASEAIRDADKPEEVRADLVRIAERLLGFAKDAARSKPLPEAREQLRELARQATVVLELPGERVLRAAARADGVAGEDAARVARVRACAGTRVGDVVARIDAQRAHWIKAWSDVRAGSPMDAARRLDHLAALCGLIADVADSGGVEMNRWPGWEMQPRVLERWAGETNTSLADGIGACVDVDVVVGSGLPGPLERARREWSLVALAGRLNRQAEVLQARTDASEDDAVRGVLELAAGMPDDLDVWLAERRGQLAVICRYAMEWDAAIEGEHEDAARAKVLRDAVAARALDMRGQLKEALE